MKKIPMILLLLAPGSILSICYFANLELTAGLYLLGAILVFNILYPFCMPRLGFNGKQILFWNLLLKLCQVPLILLILLCTLVMVLVGGKNLQDEAGSIVIIALLICWMLQLPSSMYGISGFLWLHKYGALSKAGLVASTLAQVIPCVDVIGSVLCYIMFRKKGGTAPASQSSIKKKHTKE